MTADDPARDWGGRFTLTGWSAVRRDPAAGPAWSAALALCDELCAQRANLEIDPAARAGIVKVTGRILAGPAVRRLSTQLRPLSDTAEGTLTGTRAGAAVQVRLWAEPGRRLLIVLGHEPGTPAGQVQRFWYRAHAAPLAGARAGREPDPLPPPAPTASPPVRQPATSAIPVWLADDMVRCRSMLRGAALCRRENTFEGDYSGGSTYYERSTTLRFTGDRFRLEERRLSRVSIAGMSASTPSTAASTGSWEVVPATIGSLLLLRDDDGTVQRLELIAGSKHVRLNGEMWMWIA